MMLFLHHLFPWSYNVCFYLLDTTSKLTLSPHFSKFEFYKSYNLKNSVIFFQKMLKMKFRYFCIPFFPGPCYITTLTPFYDSLGTCYEVNPSSGTGMHYKAVWDEHITKMLKMLGFHPFLPWASEQWVAMYFSWCGTIFHINLPIFINFWAVQEIL